MKVSEYVVQLLKSPDLNFPELSYLERLEHQYRSVILLEKECSLIDSRRGSRKEEKKEEDD